MKEDYINDLQDIVDFYNNIFGKIKSNFQEFENLQDYEQIYNYTAGLAISNSIHEMFIINMLKKLQLSNTKIEKIRKKYKSPSEIQNFIELLDLNLTESFNLKKDSVTLKTFILSEYRTLIEFITEQKKIRNSYLHGDYNITKKISKEEFEKFIIDYQASHSLLINLLIYSFNQNIVYIKEKINTSF